MTYAVIVLFLAVLLFAVVKISMRKTLYSFINVMLWAGVIYFLISFIEQLGVLVFEEIAYHSTPTVQKQLSESVEVFSNLSLIIVAVMSLFMIVSNISLMHHEGKRLTNVYGTLLGMAFLIGTAIVRLLTDDHLFGFAVPYLYSLLTYFECITGAIMVMGFIASRQIPKYDKDFIIILGCSISKSGGLLPLIKQRTNMAIHYAWEQEMATGKPLKYVPSGGQGKDEVMSEGSAMALYLESHGAEDYEVLSEKKSTDTHENFLFSKQIIDKQLANAKVAFATTNYHVFRSGMIARKVGFEDIEAISSKTKWYFWPNGFAREIIGIFAMTWPWHAVMALVLCAFTLITNSIIG